MSFLCLLYPPPLPSQSDLLARVWTPRRPTLQSLHPGLAFQDLFNLTRSNRNHILPPLFSTHHVQRLISSLLILWFLGTCRPHTTHTHKHKRSHLPYKHVRGEMWMPGIPEVGLTQIPPVFHSSHIIHHGMYTCIRTQLPILLCTKLKDNRRWPVSHNTQPTPSLFYFQRKQKTNERFDLAL